MEAAATKGPSSSSSSIASPAVVERPVPTTALLQQVDSIYHQFTQVVRLMSHAKRARREESPSSSRQKLCVEMEQATGALKTKVAHLQKGIRSKIEQTGRFAIVHQLKQEIEERRTAIAKIEAVLEECEARNPDK